MPSISQLTDYDAMGNVQGVAPEADGVRRVYITGQNGDSPEAAKPASYGLVDSIANKLLGLNGQERYQLWPEKVVREGLSAAGDALAGKTPQWQVDPVTGDVHTSPQMIEGAQAMSALAGSGGLAGTTDATLGATPFLRPALKYKDKLYKGKEGQAHQDVIPDALYPEFQKMAMSGDDISHYNFGFVNDKGQFLTREKALEYGVNTGLIDPSAGKYGALTSTLLADSSKPGMAIEATAKANAPQFYSALEHNVNAISQGKMTGDQWLGTLANKPGVKPEELQWSGLNEFLNSNKGKPVSKEQIKSFLDENKTELGEVVRGYNPQTTAAGKAMAESQGHKWDELSQVDQRRYIQTANGGKLTEDIGGPKYQQYQVPGGENYREVLMTLPEKNQARLKELGDRRGDLTRAERDEYTSLAEANNASRYKSSHWDEPNILAHMRMNDRNIDGKKSLHLEEVQSDWHQDGRKKGYQSEQPWELFETKTGKVVSRHDTQAEAIKARGDNNNLDYEAKRDRVPDAPFKKNWHELALKRAIREAAENGYDRLSWTAGEHHPTNPKNLNHKGPEADAADKGMQGFYNNMLPKSVEKLTGQKVHTSEMPGKLSNKMGEKAEHTKIYYIDLPQSVKDTALGKGFPLFSSSHMFTPIVGNPFESNDK